MYKNLQVMPYNHGRSGNAIFQYDKLDITNGSFNADYFFYNKPG